ncbi:NACHT domain-containing protein [Parasediminibacterium sp. JCM 36343]|uniref:NACHT domain-containing protein n=1 Tax=Parasediminibacterium sp. JCM 36343 TaxID=3374279 RepID=UPI00397910EF
MQIKRDKLLEKLYDFCSIGNGLIIGKPGVGKSFLLKELQKKLYDSGNGVPALILKVDTLLEYDDAAISIELDLSENWIQALKKISLSGKKAILIFDAFDAARDERIRKGFLNQIRKAVRELYESYNIIVTVRTYDASKSSELLKLFGASGIMNELESCRKLEIAELTDEEILQGIGGNKVLENLFYEASKELKEIIRIPFFLMLLEGISKSVTEKEINLIKQYKSEAQLLKVYWEKKIKKYRWAYRKRNICSKVNPSLSR